MARYRSEAKTRHAIGVHPLQPEYGAPIVAE